MSWNRCLTTHSAATRGTSGTPRHTKLTRYRCSLPGLAGFAGNRCTEPEVPPIVSLRSNFSLLHDRFAESSIPLGTVKASLECRHGRARLVAARIRQNVEKQRLASTTMTPTNATGE